MAIGKIFTIENGNITPKPDCTILKPLKAVIDSYPDNYDKVFYFLHAMKSMNKIDNPHADVPLEEREELVLRHLDLDIDSQDPVIQQALECVERLYYTTFYGIYIGMKNYMDKAGRVLKDLEPDFDKRTGNSDTVKNFLKDYNMMVSSYKQAYKDFEQENAPIQSWGNIEESYDLNDEEEEFE